MATLARPHIEQRTPVDLIHQVQRGAMRILPLERGFTWEAGDVTKLFDSIVRGFPIGNLLLWRRPAPAQTLHVGPLTVEAPALDSAQWVVDGQQRVTSLVGALTSAHTAADLRFRVHLDLESGTFRTASARRPAPGAWIPVSFLLDASALPKWLQIRDWLSDEQHELAVRAASAIKDYRIPASVVTTGDENSVVEMFTRINTAGKPPTRVDIIHALHARVTGDAAPTLAAVGRGTAELGFGALDEQLVLRCALAYRGGEVYRTDFPGDLASAEDQTELLGALSANLRDVVTFLRDVADIPHVKLLAYTGVIPVLVRFVRLHGAPAGRAATLLRRWVWRGAVATARDRGPSVAVLRGQLGAAERPDPVTAAAALLETAPTGPRLTVELDKVHLRQTMAKINILCLWSAEPREPGTGAPVDLGHLLDDGGALRPIFNDSELVLAGTMANRVIAPPGPASKLWRDLADASPEVAASHLLDEKTQTLLAPATRAAFLAHRAARLTAEFERHVDRMAEWGARDSRSIADLMRTG
ncbi:GmrSD restriction endonuclease domain-containing protein [Dactylosporangium sp. CA-139114]|uniref:GmrSD restriction endonuclease domain-containing protein n=1 Tax=Dactylosporangium sp. CA-139114 TaxID=3239931 RepID=UPI003D98C389